MHQLPAVSVIVITKDRHNIALQAVDSILKTDYPEHLRSVIVLEETDSPSPVKGNNLRYETIPSLNKGFAYARNFALKFAPDDIVVFTDDDCIVQKDWLKNLLEPLLTDDNVAAVAGAVLVPECGSIGKCENILGFPGGGLLRIHKSKGKVAETNTFSTCNCAIKKDALIRAGSFDEKLIYGGEDEFLSCQIKKMGKIIFTPYAKVLHQPRNSWKKIWQWFLRRGRAEWHVRHSKKIDRESAYLFLTTSPYLRGGAVLVLAILLNFWLLPAALLLYYIWIILRYRWIYAYGYSFNTLLLLPLVRTWMDMAYHTGFFLESLKHI
jgi:GT2 family glycosyltransferase